MAAPPRPRLLYSALFAWLAVTGGRFLAPFLEHEASFDSDTMIGSLLATQCAVTSFLGSAGGSWADSREQHLPGRGRAEIMFLGVSVGSLAFLLQGLHVLLPGRTVFVSPEWHFCLRILWASSVSLIVPVIDGMTLAHLEKAPGMETSDYGKERLYGAISWAVANLMIGPLADCFGFRVLFPFSMFVTAIYLTSIIVYVKGQDAPSVKLDDEGDPVGSAHHSSKSEQESPPPQEWTTLVCILVGSIYGAAFCFAVSCLSSGTSVVESLVFVFFEFLGGSNTMCAITVALTVMFEIPIFHVAPQLLKRVGASKLLHISGLAYVLRVVGYSLIPKGKMWWVLLLEPLHGVTYACAQTSSVEVCAQVMPKGSEASGQGLLGVFKGIGSVTGLLVGGVLEERLGPRIMYRIFAAIVTVGMSFFGLAGCCHRSKALHHPLPTKDSDLTLWERNDENETAMESCDAIELVPSNEARVTA